MSQKKQKIVSVCGVFARSHKNMTDETHTFLPPRTPVRSIANWQHTLFFFWHTTETLNRRSFAFISDSRAARRSRNPPRISSRLSRQRHRKARGDLIARSIGRRSTLRRVVQSPFDKNTTLPKMATTMTMSAACAQPLAARKSFGSKAKLGAPVKTRAARVNTVVRAARDGPVVIGLAADSGVSTAMRHMTSLFGGKASPEGGNPDSNTLIQHTVLCLDDYHLNDREGRKKSDLTAQPRGAGLRYVPESLPNARDRPRTGRIRPDEHAGATHRTRRTHARFTVFFPRRGARDAPPPVVFKLRAYPRARWHSSNIHSPRRRDAARTRLTVSFLPSTRRPHVRPGQGAQGG